MTAQKTAGKLTTNTPTDDEIGHRVLKNKTPVAWELMYEGKILPPMGASRVINELIAERNAAREKVIELQEELEDQAASLKAINERTRLNALSSATEILGKLVEAGVVPNEEAGAALVSSARIIEGFLSGTAAVESALVPPLRKKEEIPEEVEALKHQLEAMQDSGLYNAGWNACIDHLLATARKLNYAWLSIRVERMEAMKR